MYDVTQTHFANLLLFVSFFNEQLKEGNIIG